MISLADIKEPLILYDGFCVLCNRATGYIIRQDIEVRIKLLPLNKASELLLPTDLNAHKDSVVLILNGRIYVCSEAVIRAWMLTGDAKVKSLLLLIPKFMRDGIYNLIARNRYKWFGSYEVCPLLPETRIFKIHTP